MKAEPVDLINEFLGPLHLDPVAELKLSVNSRMRNTS